ncbi:MULTISPECIES: tyrosine-type recombinase/integrase [unclassified Microcoleus]|uniref:tyrosine-type recombinase/integrase n=1 Tax=unclassified Microcoleus TaxID=2642155 RepID=UPI002FD76803
MRADKRPQPCDVTVYSDKGSLALRFPKRHASLWEQLDGKRPNKDIKTLGIGKYGYKDNPEDWKRATQLAIALEADLDHPEWEKLFDPTLAKYGLGGGKYAKLADVLQLPGTKQPEPEITVGEMWEAYLEWKKTVIEETTFKATYERKFSNLVYGQVWDNQARVYKKANNCSLSKISLNDSQLNEKLAEIKSHAKSLFLKELKRAFEFSKTKKLLRHETADPFVDIEKYAVPALTTQDKYAPKIINGEEKQWHEVLDEKSLEENRRAFTREERDIIIKAFYESESYSTREYIAPLIEFYFLTGCRTSEAFALTWNDVDFQRQTIRFSKSLGATTGKVKETKTGEVRLFYFKKGSRLEKLILTIKQKSINSKLVFTNTKGERVTASLLKSHWLYYVNKKTLADGTVKSYHYPGIVTRLADEGKISGYLPQYHTRHTYITLAAEANKHNNNALLLIATSCGNSVDVILRHYLGLSEASEIVEA